MIVLVEDERHEMLVRRYLRRRGMGREVRIVPFPAGRGSAEQWVRNRFAVEVSAYRHRRDGKKAQTELIVMTDADTLSVDERITQSGEALREAEVEPVGANEAIAQLIPKRNVETWILCLHGENVEELRDYKGTRDDWNELISEASATLHQWTRPKAAAPGHCIDSLARAITQLRRLES